MDSYNSRYPLEYYSVGIPYMFYMRSDGYLLGRAATMEQIKQYGSAIKADSSTGNPKESTFGGKFGRYIGVVTDKHEESSPAIIDVLFQCDHEGKRVYLLKKYSVAPTGVFFDDKENVAAHVSVPLPKDASIDFPAQAAKSGGITLNEPGKRSGGITLNESKKQAGGTRLNEPKKKSGGITLNEA